MQRSRAGRRGVGCNRHATTISLAQLTRAPDHRGASLALLLPAVGVGVNSSRNRLPPLACQSYS